MKTLRTLYFIAIVVTGGSFAQAALITNPALPITHQVKVQPIIVSDNNGTNTAEYFGSASQEAEILGFVDTIWAQAGFDIEFLPANFWNNTFVNTGSPGMNNPRPGNDLNSIVILGDDAGVTSPDSNTINMFFVEIAAGFSETSENSANGLAFVGGNGITQHVGDNLVDFTLGREVVASVVAHEIGHNLGLPHISEAQNLMQAGGANNQGERLNAAQIAIATTSTFSTVVAVPEPSSMIFLGVVAGGIFYRSRKATTSMLGSAA